MKIVANNLKKNTYIYRNEKWWFYAIRSINYFAFRYWWILLLIFITGILLLYFFCLNKSSDCEKYNYAINRSSEAISALESCCNCKTPENAIPCNTATSEAGGEGYYENTHLLGGSPGTVYIKYDMYSQKDRMDIYYDDKIVASTGGLVSDVGTLKFFYEAKRNKPNFCRIVLTAPESGTSWEYLVSCPQ